MLRVNDPPCMGLRITLASLPSVTLARVSFKTLARGKRKRFDGEKRNPLGVTNQPPPRGFLFIDMGALELALCGLEDLV